jgi:hypothetical protein
LADNGKWEQLTYEGETANYWTPTNVAPDWSPFTVGQWTTWQGEQLWVPYEPFGWVTHHYGGWVFHNHHWWWRPPVRVSGWRYVPWYPARVVWVNHGRYVGWVPCGWHEVYYGRRYWGPRTVVFRENIHIRDVELRRYANVNRAVIIDKERFYNPHTRYESVKDAKVIGDVVHSGHAEHVLTRDTLRGANFSMEHHFARSGDFSQKPQVVAFNKPQGFGHGGENAKALGDRIVKANALNPAPRTNQPLPFAEQKGQGNRRELPQLPQNLHTGRGQHMEAAIKGHPGPQGQAQDQLQAQKHNQQLQQQQRQQAMQQRQHTQQQQQLLQAQRQQQFQAQRQQQIERQQAIQQQNQQQRLAQQQARQQQLQQLQQQKQAQHQQNQAQQQQQHLNQQGKHQHQGN